MTKEFNELLANIDKSIEEERALQITLVAYSTEYRDSLKRELTQLEAKSSLLNDRIK